MNDNVRKDISLVIAPSLGWSAINGNDMGNQYCNTMLKEWIKNGETLTLSITSPEIPFTQFILKRVDKAKH
jgi:hypothetical protein